MLSQSCLQPNWSPRQRLTAGTQGKHRVPAQCKAPLQLFPQLEPEEEAGGVW